MAAPFDLIVCGSGGQPDYSQRFAAWGERLRQALVQNMHHPPQNIRLLTESSSASPSSLEHIAASIDQLVQSLDREDVLFVYLIGHGSYRNDTAKLNIPGPDLSAAALDSMLQKSAAGRIVVINAASASAAFINVLSAPGRIVCSSTSSVEERNATWFMEYFAQGLEEESADQNRDERISILEACRQAAELTGAHYAADNLIATEHALLDDDGDGLGSRLPLDGDDDDGALAARTYLKDFRFPPQVPASVVHAYRTSLRQVEEFIRQKGTIEEGEYYKRLEELLVRTAQLNRQIRSFQKPP